MGYAACPLNIPDLQNSTANCQREGWPPGEAHFLIAPMPVLETISQYLFMSLCVLIYLKFILKDPFKTVSLSSCVSVSVHL